MVIPAAIMGTAAVLADANEVSLGVVDAAFFFFLLFFVPPLLTEAFFNDDDVCGGARSTAVVEEVDSILVLLPVPALMELPLDMAGINFLLLLFAVVLFDSADCSPLVAVGEGIPLDRRDIVVGAILPVVDPCTLFF